MKNNFLYFAILFFFSCSDSNISETNSLATHTLIIYMAADNNLYDNAIQDINEMLSCTIPDNCNLIIYLDAPLNTADSLPKISYVKNRKLCLIRKYEHQNSASAKTLNRVLKDAINLFPADNYGLVLWSHGSGWLPEGVFEKYLQQNISIKNNIQFSFGKDYRDEMDIIDLENALPIKFEYVVFDACLMSNIEVLYQLRNKANYIIASPTEEFGNGYPYGDVLPFLLSLDYKNVAIKYMDYYKKKSGIFQSATIAIVDSRKLDDLAFCLNQVNKNQMDSIKICIDTIQKYQLNTNCFYYDLQDVLKHSYNNFDYSIVCEKLSNSVVYKDFTTYFMRELTINNSCGISVFVFPFYDKELINKYKQLDWYINTKLIVKKHH